jgi:hypothetical protein
MENGLFGIYQERDIYFTLDMYRILSPRSASNQVIKTSGNNNDDVREEQKSP